MSQAHPFGELLTQLRSRVPGLTQQRLAHAIGYDTAVVTRMAQGKKDLTGPSGRDRVILVLQVLAEHGALLSIEEANALLASAQQPPLYDGLPLEAGLIHRLAPGRDTRERARGERYEPPLPPTPLIGRGREIKQVIEVLAANRLVTLIGPGGSGKTRVAIEAARVFAERLTNGACFVDLSQTRDADTAPQLIADALHLPALTNQAPMEQVQRFLARRSVLLVLDNYEHLPAAVALVSKLLAAVGSLRVLATSREPLRLRGEHTIAIDPLAQPEAVALFKQCAATALQHESSVTESDRHIDGICTRLDGLPLAIELAASQVGQLGLAALAQHLAKPFHALPNIAGTLRDLPNRQQTMRDTIEWSVALLNPDERLVFRRLGVFVGECEAEQIACVCPELDSTQAQRCILSLVEKNLVRVRRQAGAVDRYRSLELIREYALWQLDRQNETTVARNLHAIAYAALAEQCLQAALRDEQQWVHALDSAMMNIASALAWCFEQGGDPSIGSRLYMLLMPPGPALARHMSLLRRWYDTARERMPPDTPAFVHANCLLRSRNYSTRSGIAEVEADLRQAVGLSDTTDHTDSQISARGHLADLIVLNGGDIEEAKHLIDQAMTLAEGDVRLTVQAVHCKAVLCGNLGDLVGEESCLRQCLDYFYGQGDETAIADICEASFMLAGSPLMKTGRYVEACEVIKRALDYPHETNDSYSEQLLLPYMSECLRLCGDAAGAVRAAQNAIAAAREVHGVDEPLFENLVLSNALYAAADVEASVAVLRKLLARIISEQDVYRPHVARLLDLVTLHLSDRGEHALASRCLGAADAVYPNGVRTYGTNRAVTNAPVVARCRAALGDAAYDANYAEGSETAWRELVAQITPLIA